MSFPSDLGIIDTMIGFPHRGQMKETYAFITRQTKDRQSKEEFAFPVEYMFKQVPEKDIATDDPIAFTVSEMDRWGVEKGLIGVGGPGGVGEQALKRYPDRFIPSAGCDPNAGMDGIRELTALYETHGSPGGDAPSRPAPSRRWPSTTRRCTRSTRSAWSSGSPIFCTAGVPGPRLKFAVQHVELIDEVMYDFPDLVFVTRHGCEPWADLAVKLMLKWPGLHFSTSAFAPRYYPQGGHRLRQHPRGGQVHLRRLLPHGSLARADHDRDARPPTVGSDVWPKFLRENALRVLGLDR